MPVSINLSTGRVYPSLKPEHRVILLKAAELDFSDEDNEKGFYLVDIEPEGANGKRQVFFDFHPLQTRRFLTISVSITTEDTDPTATVLRAISGREDKIGDAIVRLEITLPARSEGLLRDIEIRDALKDAYYSTIAREIQREVRMRLGQFTAEDIAPLDALKAYLESKKVPPGRTKILLEYGERLIQGKVK